jgi:AcrR family transcriptional regulator
MSRQPMTLLARADAPADDKRAAILDAALILFGRYGFRRTSVDDIARHAGIAKGTVYLYFATKEEIFQALSQTVIERVLAAAEQARSLAVPFDERLRHVLNAKFGFFQKIVLGSPHARELIDSTNRLCATQYEAFDRTYLRIVTALITEAVARGEIVLGPVGIEPAEVADLVVAGARGLEPDDTGTGAARLFQRRLDALVQLVVAAATPRGRRRPVREIRRKRPR